MGTPAVDCTATRQRRSNLQHPQEQQGPSQATCGDVETDLPPRHKHGDVTALTRLNSDSNTDSEPDEEGSDSGGERETEPDSDGSGDGMPRAV